jgi:hypothetical protein
MSTRYAIVLLIIVISSLAFSGYTYFRLLNSSNELASLTNQASEKQDKLDQLQAAYDKLQNSQNTTNTDNQNEITADKSQITLLSQQLSESQKEKLDISAKLLECQDELVTFQKKQSQQQADEAERQKKAIPLPILEALNDMTNSVSTGISKNDYGNKLISLKTAIATYGNNLPPGKSDVLTTIVANYDTALMFWNKSSLTNPWNDLGLTLTLETTNINDKPLVDLLSKYNISYEKESIGASLYRVYNPPTVFSIFWKMAADSTSALISNENK